MSEAQDETKPQNTADDATAGAAADVADDAAPENVSERWMKYGLNVGLTSLLVLVLAFLVVWGAQRWRKRGDLTSAGSYSLKPQTVSIISEVKSPVKLVSLQTRLKPEPGKADTAQQEQTDKQDYYQPVNDILQEYK